MNPLKLLFESRKFWLLVLDGVVSLILLVIAEVAPNFQEMANQLIAILQPVVVAVIVGIFVEDAAAKLKSKQPIILL